MVALIKWNHEVFRGKQEEIKRVRQKLGFILAQPLTKEAIAERETLLLRLDLLLGQEGKYWRQHSRALWVNEGDRNTRFFHQRAKTRQAKNSIKRIRNMDEDWVTNEHGIESTITCYFRDIFCSSSNLNDVKVIGAVDTRITSDMNRTLERDISDDEVRVAVFQMQPSKAPGPDGMNLFFF